ncbi:hypothetical protein [Streptomyces spectabilis]|uniref:Uncharacterized protein n=1 Tax=Streptomyces spectabilis TaxID=68270 RepID=A0A7W8B3P2_STRST|nr:hypothetical protein [Streptomyces spectabilis]MBB5109779.1 hypothetical protein [Streptomyces spectabilis]
MIDPNVITEESRRLAGDVSDQRLGLGQLQLEFLTQEHPNLGLDLLDLALRPGESQQPVVGVTDIPKPPVVRVLARHGTTLKLKPPHRLPVAAPLGPLDRELHAPVCRVRTTPFAAILFRQQRLLDELVQPVKVDIRENRRRDSSLRYPVEGVVPSPVLQI